MPQLHVAKVNDCISSIALEHGFFPDTIWNDPDNADLRRVRRDPNVLRTGDLVVIPDKRLKEEDKSINQRHQFRRKGFPTTIHLRLMRNGIPRANQLFQFVIDGKIHSGKTDQNGKLWVYIPANSRRAMLYVGEGDTREEYGLKLRYLQPITDVKGVQQRLNNLGYGCGDESGEMTQETIAAIKRFQQENNLVVTGEHNAETQKKLLMVHGS